MKPLIGVPTAPYKADFAYMELDDVPQEKLKYFWLRSKLNKNIFDSVRRAGGVPIELLPADGDEETSALVSRLDGFIFSGGEDIHPQFYGEEPNGSQAPDERRDAFELGLCKKILDAGKPALGICRGAQLINVALGGTLYQDLTAVRQGWGREHARYESKDGYVHSVNILKSGFFIGADSGTIGVNSMHHQAVKSLADGLEPLAVTEDGLIEAFRLKEHAFFAAVQWHPECLSHKNALQAALFNSLVDSSIQTNIKLKNADAI